jgi:RNA recognition motif-containing protein
MSKVLYITNLPPTLTDDELLALLSEAGEVQDLQVERDPETQAMKAARFIMQDSKKIAVVQQLNGRALDGRRVAISFSDFLLDSKRTKAVQECAQQLTQHLHEESEALPRIERIARYCGIEFARAIADEAVEIEAQGGLMTYDGTRRRTLGGVFFQLVRKRVSPPVYKELFYFKPKRPKGNPAQQKNQAAPALPPAPKPIKILSPEVREQFTQLQSQLNEAQQQIDEMRKSPGKQAKVFSALKNVVDIQKQIDAMVKEYPDLSQ